MARIRLRLRLRLRLRVRVRVRASPNPNPNPNQESGHVHGGPEGAVLLGLDDPDDCAVRWLGLGLG